MATATPAQLVDAHSAARASLTDAAAAYAASQTEAFGGWFDTAAITEFSDRVSRRVQSAQKHVAGTTDSFLLRVLRLLLGRQVRSDGTVDVTAGFRLGVTPAGVYGRAADTYRYQRSLGKSDDEALKLAVQRARVAAEYDVTLAFRAQVQSTLTAVAQSQRLVPLPRTEQVGVVVDGADSTPDEVPADAGPVLGFRRVIHPELAKPGQSCGLCLVASDRCYSYKDLLPLHNGCNCSVLPVLVDHDPGLRINASDLARLYKDAGGTDRSKLQRTRYTVLLDGETGPTLVYANQRNRDAADVARDTQRGASAA